MGYVLRNPRYELFAQGLALGLIPHEAYLKAGFKAKTPANANLLAKRPEIRQRVDELLKASAARSELSRKQILDRIFQDWELARKLGQIASALKAGELMGREMHRMFVERKEIGGPGDFDNKTEDELRDIIKKELDDLGWEGVDTPSNSTTTH